MIKLPQSVTPAVPSTTMCKPILHQCQEKRPPPSDFSHRYQSAMSVLLTQPNVPSQTQSKALSESKHPNDVELRIEACNKKQYLPGYSHALHNTQRHRARITEKWNRCRNSNRGQKRGTKIKLNELDEVFPRMARVQRSRRCQSSLR